MAKLSCTLSEINVFLLNETWVARLLAFQKLTSPLKINGWNMYFPNVESLFRGHVNFLGCTC